MDVGTLQEKPATLLTLCVAIRWASSLGKPIATAPVTQLLVSILSLLRNVV